MEWIREKVSWTLGKWMTIIFSDEIQCYWHDLRKEEQAFSKRLFGGGSVMIWGVFSSNGKAELVVMKGRQNAQKYVEVLETSLRPFGKVHHGQDFILHQDNASIHTTKVTIAWFDVKMLPY